MAGEISNDDDEDDDDSENFLDHNNQLDEEEEDEDDDDDGGGEAANSSSFIKRRRLNSNLNVSNISHKSSSAAMQNSKQVKMNKSRLRYHQPTKLIKCRQSKRIRAMAFNPKRQEIAAISMNAAFHYFDIRRFEQKYTKKLSPLKENVCLTINGDYTIYAIGSASHVQLLDASNARPLTNPIFVKNEIGIRSVHFRNNMLSIGTGIGSVLFYDLRSHRFLNYDDYGLDHSSQAVSRGGEQVKLQTNGGWLLRNETYYDNLPFGSNTDNFHAIYSHSYDPSGTRLLTVGGPLTVSLYGHYAALWQ